MSDYYQTTREILQGFEQLHRQLARHYRQMGDNTSQERLKLLLDYLDSHEKRLQKAMQRTAADTGANVLNTWYRDAPALDNVMATLAPRTPDSLETLVEQVQTLNQHLVQMFEQLAANGPIDSVRELFTDLARQEKQEATQIQWAALRLQDM